MGKFLERMEKEHTLDDSQRSLFTAIDTYLEENKGSVEDLAKRAKDAEEAVKKLKDEYPADIVNSMRQEIEAMKKERKDNRKSFREEMKANAADIEAALRKERKPFEMEFELHNRAAVLMTMTNTMKSGLMNTYAKDLGWDEIRYPENFIIDVIGGREVANVPQRAYKKLQGTIEGGATIVAPSGLKPLISTSFDLAYFERIKYASRFEVEEELKDFDEIYNRIIEVATSDLIRKYKAGTFSWLTTNATSYVSSVLDDTQVKPTLGAVVSALALQIASLNFTPDVCYMNIADFESQKWEQDNNGQFIVNPSATLGSSLRIFVDNSIPQGYVLVGDTTTIGEMHSAIRVRFGGYTSTAKFEHNQESNVVEIFSLPYLLERNEGAWIYESISVVKAALQKPAEAPIHYTLEAPTADAIGPQYASLSAASNYSLATSDYVRIEISLTNDFAQIISVPVTYSDDKKTVYASFTDLTHATQYYARLRVVHNGIEDISYASNFTTQE